MPTTSAAKGTSSKRTTKPKTGEWVTLTMQVDPAVAGALLEFLKTHTGVHDPVIKNAKYWAEAKAEHERQVNAHHHQSLYARERRAKNAQS
jgi:hypothetical protein